MNENDNILIEQFFREAAQQQIEDNGFSERVMAAIDADYSLQGEKAKSGMTLIFQRLWTLFCLVVAVMVFVAMQGWTMLLSYAAVFVTNIEVFFRTLPTMFDLSLLGDMTASTPMVTLLEVVLALVILMALSIAGLTRWVIRQV